MIRGFVVPCGTLLFYAGVLFKKGSNRFGSSKPEGWASPIRKVGGCSLVAGKWGWGRLRGCLDCGRLFVILP